MSFFSMKTGFICAYYLRHSFLGVFAPFPDLHYSFSEYNAISVGVKRPDSGSLAMCGVQCFVAELEDKYVCSVSIPPSILPCFASLSFSLHLSFFTEDSVVQTPTKAAKARRFLLPFVLCSHDSPPKGTRCSCVCV